MFAVYAESMDPKDPLAGLVVGERPEPTVPEGWTTVTVKAASINHHDVWSLRRSRTARRGAADDFGLRCGRLTNR